MEFLKDVLGEDLYVQVAEKLSKSDVKIANLADGGYVNKDKFLAAEKTANELQAQIAERDKQLAALQKSTGDADALKAQIVELQAANETVVTEYKEKLSKSQLESAKKIAIANAQPANEIAAKAIEKLIDDAQIKAGKDGYEGITEQIAAIVESLPSLVKTSVKPKAGGVNPPTSDDDQPTKWQNDYNAAKERGDTKAAIRITQDAFAEGVVLN